MHTGGSLLAVSTIDESMPMVTPFRLFVLRYRRWVLSTGYTQMGEMSRKYILLTFLVPSHFGQASHPALACSASRWVYRTFDR